MLYLWRYIFSSCRTQSKHQLLAFYFQGKYLVNDAENRAVKRIRKSISSWK